MPKLGMEPVRRRALIEAAITEIGGEGSLEVSMSRIARTAGVSPALAHHYFGGKDRLLLATMRHLLGELGRRAAGALGGATDPRERLSAVVAQNFSEEQFAPGIVAAWLAFYVHAQSEPEARRLLRVYARRLRSNLLDSLRRLVPTTDAERIAEGTAALIDGVYLRRALKDEPPDPAGAVALVEDYLDRQLGGARS